MKFKVGVFRLFICMGIILHVGPLFSSASDRGVDAFFDRTYSGNVSAGNDMLYTFSHNTSKDEAVRFHFLSDDAEPDFPILLVVKQPRSVLSWTVPYVAPDGQKYGSVSKTLCPDNFNHNTSIEETIIVVVSTSSTSNVTFTLTAMFVGHFNLQSNKNITFSSNPAAPQYYQYEFPEGVDMVLVKAKSKNKTCAYLSVQNAKCPIFDDVSTVRYNEGTFQTMTLQAAISVTRDMYKSGLFYVVVVVHSNDNMCDNNYKTLTPLEAQDSGSSPRTKIVTLTVANTLETHEYWKPIVTTFGVIIAIYFLSGFIIAGNIVRQRKADLQAGTVSERVVLLDPESDTEGGQTPFAQSDSASGNYGTAGPGPGLEPNNRLDNVVRNGSSPTSERHLSSGRRKPDAGDRILVSSDDETDIDMLDDIESTKEVYRTKTELFVSDLSRKKVNTLEKKYNMYAWNLITVSVFYALPVVQLVITYQVVTNVTGNQDSCYYNFLCAKPYGWFSAFNNVFSNTGYVMLGILFLLLVWRKEYVHKRRVKAGYTNELTHGIPKHYGLLYTLGYALIMEGVMSGSYHVCPNRANYQFDTAYMYMIACLGMLKMYQQRHPDINANSYKSFALFALILFIGFLGLVFIASIYFYVIFFLVHMLTCLGLSAQIYYMGTVKIDGGVFKRTFLICKSDIFACARPTHPTRVALLTVGIVVNLALSILGLVTRPLDFASYLLAIMIVNMLLYLSFYFIMKLICREKILLVVILLITLTLFLWAAALYFFQIKNTGWQLSAAQSRELNTDCTIMGFFDGHDTWHFLSAFGLFVSFVGVLLLDDDLEQTPRNRIRVF